MRQTMAILRNRWLEVVLLLAMKTVHSLLYLTLHPPGSPFFYKPAMRVMGMYVFFAMLHLLLLALATVMTFGFVRLARLHGKTHQPFAALWRTGILFLGRLLVFNLLLAVLILIVGALFTAVTAPLLSHIRIVNTKAIAHFIVVLSSILLMKPAMYVPAVIFDRNCRLRDAWKMMRSFQIFETPQLPALYLAMELVSNCQRLLPGTAIATSVLLPAATTIASNFIWLVILLEAVRIVGTSDEQLLDLNPSAANAQTLPPGSSAEI
jgi:hypothetical protein